MQLSSIYIRNFKAFKSFKVSLSDMNILIGSNNSGKTTVITTLRRYLLLWNMEAKKAKL